MIIINNNKSNVEKIEVDWAEYTSTQKKIFKDSVIFFMITGMNDKNENIQLDIETIFSADKVKNLELKKEINISEYITDVIYMINGIAYLDLSDEIEDDIEVAITKINNKTYNIKANSEKIKFSLDGSFNL